MSTKEIRAEQRLAEYRAKAETALQRADEAQSHEARHMWLAIGAIWRMLATHIAILRR